MANGNKSKWFQQRSARTFFGFAAIATVTLELLLASVMVIVQLLGQQILKPFLDSTWVQAFGFIIGIVAAPCAICLWIGMLWYWTAADQSNRSLRFIWLILLILGNWLVAPLYYYFFYRRQTSA